METDKEIVVVKQQSSKALTAATDLVVATEEDYKVAGELRAKIKQVGKLIKEKKESVSRPLLDALNNFRDLFKPIEQSQKQAEELVDSKMLTFYKEQQCKREEEKLKIAQKVETGYIKPETAIKKMENLTEAPQAVKSEVGTTFVKKIPSMRIVDEKLIPDEYWVIDMVKLRQAVVRERKEVPGVEYYEEETMGGRS